MILKEALDRAETETQGTVLEVFDRIVQNGGDIQEALNKSLSRLHQHVQNRNVGMITAHRGGNETVEDRARNNKRNAALKHDIHKAGFGYAHVRGRYIEGHKTAHERPVDEHSFVVIGKKGHDGGKLKEFLKKHGEKYDQDSVVHKAHDSKKATLVGTSKRADSYPGHGKEEDLGEFHPNRAGEFHSVMKGRVRQGPLKKGKTQGNHRTFAFAHESQGEDPAEAIAVWEDYAVLNPVTFSSRKETLWDLPED
jgi:hypothetical protein